jgi:hypothetical protein
MYAITALNFVLLTMFGAPTRAYYFYMVTCVYPARMCARTSNRFPLLVCRFNAGIYSMCCELRIDALKLLALGVCFSVMRAIGCTLDFSFCFGALFCVLRM